MRRGHAISARLDEEEYAAYSRALAAFQGELRALGVQVGSSDYLRHLVTRDAKARGVDATPAAPPPAPAPPPSTKPARKR